MQRSPTGRLLPSLKFPAPKCRATFRMSLTGLLRAEDAVVRPRPFPQEPPCPQGRGCPGNIYGILRISTPTYSVRPTARVSLADQNFGSEGASWLVISWAPVRQLEPGGDARISSSTKKNAWARLSAMRFLIPESSPCRCDKLSLGGYGPHLFFLVLQGDATGAFGFHFIPARSAR